MKPIDITACGGVLFRIKSGEAEILLIKRNGFWDIPKGKIEGNETLEMCAARELMEEVGCEMPHIVTTLGTTNHSYEMEGSVFDKITWWYLMIVKEFKPVPQREEAIEQARWVTLKKAGEMVAYDNLKSVIKRCVRLIG